MEHHKHPSAMAQGVIIQWCKFIRHYVKIRKVNALPSKLCCLLSDGECFLMSNASRISMSNLLSPVFITSKSLWVSSPLERQSLQYGHSLICMPIAEHCVLRCSSALTPKCLLVSPIYEIPASCWQVNLYTTWDSTKGLDLHFSVKQFLTLNDSNTILSFLS